jgi:hypothetical protein
VQVFEVNPDQFLSDTTTHSAEAAYESLHVSSNLVLVIGRVNCISTTSGICHSV